MEKDEQEEIELVVKANLPTRYGNFTIHGFKDTVTGEEHTALVHGEVGETEDCPLRIHSECHTGDIFGSLRCDCRDQLEASLQYIGNQPFGVVIYLRQEGRGIGLFNKLKAYNLQDEGFDTVEANLELGLPADNRDYRVAARIIQVLGIRSVALLTNNPAKIEGLKSYGIEITRRIPLVIPPNRFSKRYLETKRNRMGHMLDDR